MSSSSRRRGRLAWLGGLAAALVVAACSTPGGAVPGAEPTLGDPDRGQRLISDYGCGSCHVVPGVNGADGLVGPPLTDFGRRSYIAGVLPNNADNLQHWISDPQSEPARAALLTSPCMRPSRCQIPVKIGATKPTSRISMATNVHAAPVTRIAFLWKRERPPSRRTSSTFRLGALTAMSAVVIFG